MRVATADAPRSVGASGATSILVVEGSESTRQRIRALLRAPDREVLTAETAREGMARALAAPPDLLVVSMDGGVAFSTLEALCERFSGVPVVVAASAPDIDEAVHAVRAGAVEYIGLDAPPARWSDLAEKILREAIVSRQLESAQATIRDQYGFLHLLTQSPRMIEVFDQIRAVAGTDATVLVLGETGTGKELVSQAVHQRSRRKDKTLVAVNCGAFTESLLESELFGHERGSFTGAERRREGLFEMADGGTLFLDELGETSLSVQVNLLRVLEEMCFRRVGGRDMVHVDVRIVAATNNNLPEQVRAGKFREDLFYRLNVFPIRLPPLRERREDIPLLVRHFLDEFAQEYELDPPMLSGEAVRAILTYPWPGNVRQLRAMCERWTITRAGQRLEAHHLPADFGHVPAGPVAQPGATAVDLEHSLSENVARVTDQIERTYLKRLLERERGHLGQTAIRAGISRRTLYTKLRDLGLDADEFR